MLQENGSQSWLGMMLLQLIRVPPTGLIRLRLRISAIVTASINYLMGQWVSLSLSLPETNLGDELVQFDEFLGSTAGLPRCNMLLQLLAIWRCSMTCGICKGNDVMQHTTISYIINHYHTLNVTQRMVSDFSILFSPHISTIHIYTYLTFLAKDLHLRFVDFIFTSDMDKNPRLLADVEAK